MVTTSSRRRAPCASIWSVRSRSSRRRVVAGTPDADDLAVHGVSERHRPATQVRTDADETGPFELLDRAGTDDRLEHRQTDRLPQRDLVEHGSRLRIEHIEPRRDRVGQAGARHERPGQPPHAAVPSELSAVDGSEDELAGVQHVALTDRPDRVDGVRGDRAAERRPQQDRRARPARSRRGRLAPMRSSRHSAATLLGTDSPLRTVPTRKFKPSIEKLAGERRRRRVEQLEVVDEQDHSAALAPGLDGLGDLGEQREWIAPVEEDACRQQVGDGAEWNLPSSVRWRRPARTIGPPPPATVRTSSANRVLPTPGAPWMTTPSTCRGRRASRRSPPPRRCGRRTAIASVSNRRPRRPCDQVSCGQRTAGRRRAQGVAPSHVRQLSMWCSCRGTVRSAQSVHDNAHPFPSSPDTPHRVPARPARHHSGSRRSRVGTATGPRPSKATTAAMWADRSAVTARARHRWWSRHRAAPRPSARRRGNGCRSRRSVRRRVGETVALIEASGGIAAAAVADVTDEWSMGSAVERLREQLGPVDLLINNAGIVGPVGPAWEVAIDDWWRTMEVNVRGTILATQLVLPEMVPPPGPHREPQQPGGRVPLAARVRVLGVEGRHREVHREPRARDGPARRRGVQRSPRPAARGHERAGLRRRRAGRVERGARLRLGATRDRRGSGREARVRRRDDPEAGVGPATTSCRAVSSRCTTTSTPSSRRSTLSATASCTCSASRSCRRSPRNSAGSRPSRGRLRSAGSSGAKRRKEPHKHLRRPEAKSAVHQVGEALGGLDALLDHRVDDVLDGRTLVGLADHLAGRVEVHRPWPARGTGGRAAPRRT